MRVSQSMRSPSLPAFLRVLVWLGLTGSILTGAVGCIGTIIEVAVGGGSLLTLLALVIFAAMVVIPIRVIAKGYLASPRVVLALVTFYYGWLGLDLLFGGREQRFLFAIALVFLVLLLVLAVLGWAGGAWSGTGAGYALVVPIVPLVYWQVARFFEYLWMDDEGFESLRRGEYATQSSAELQRR